jgi:excisionase family DNA binding protein
MKTGPSNPENETPVVGELLTVKEAATLLKATPNTVTIWCRAGQLPAMKIGRQWRISKGELDRMVSRPLGADKTRLAATYGQEDQDEQE